MRVKHYHKVRYFDLKQGGLRLLVTTVCHESKTISSIVQLDNILYDDR